MPVTGTLRRLTIIKRHSMHIPCLFARPSSQEESRLSRFSHYWGASLSLHAITPTSDSFTCCSTVSKGLTRLTGDGCHCPDLIGSLDDSWLIGPCLPPMPLLWQGSRLHHGRLPDCMFNCPIFCSPRLCSAKIDRALQ